MSNGRRGSTEGLIGPTNDAVVIGAIAEGEARGSEVGTLGGLGASSVDSVPIRIDPGAGWQLAGTGGTPPVFISHGTNLDIDSGRLVFGAVGEGHTNTGMTGVGGDGVAEFQRAVSGGPIPTSLDRAGTLRLDDPAEVGATISGFGAGDTVHPSNMSATNLIYAGGIFSVPNSGLVAAPTIDGTAGSEITPAADPAPAAVDAVASSIVEAVPTAASAPVGELALSSESQFDNAVALAADPAPNLVTGLGGPAGFGPNIVDIGDDNSTSVIPITSVFADGLNFFNHTYTSLYINNNGNITFNGPNSTFTPDQITANTNIPIIAPYFADVDTRGGAGQSTGGNSTGSNRVYYSLDTVSHIFTVTWDDVGYYSAHTNKLDAFQLQLIDRGNGDFDIEFRYEAINWTTGDASGGNNGLGGIVAVAGFSAGDSVNFFQLPQSGNQNAMLGLPTTAAPAGTLGAQIETGVYIYQVRNGVVPHSTLYDFVFTYNDLKDYYYGTVSDNGGHGYQPGQQFRIASGQYDIYNQEGATSQASGTVFVTYYSHGGLGQASYTPLGDSQGLAAGSNGLGSEGDSILGTDGLYHPFSASTEAAISSSALYGFVFNYSDAAAYYFGTVADNGTYGYAAIADSSSPYLLVGDGYYQLFSEGVTGNTSGTVTVNGYRDGRNATTFTDVHPANGVAFGSAGLGSEAGYYISGGNHFNFTDTSEAFDPPPPAGASAAARGDFNGDGKSDLLWQNNSGEVAIWEMKETGVIRGGSLGNPGPSWHTIGTGDFNGDGKSDVLWQNDSGAVVVWEMNGTSVIGGGQVGSNPGPSWHAISTGDFNGDGYSDILWQNDNSAVAIWDLNGTGTIGGGGPGNPGPSWHAVGAGDFNGDGRSDILWQNDSGEVSIWEVNDTSVIGGGSLGNPGPSWHVIGTGDFNGDGRSDILWQSDSGEVSIWEMNGTSVIGGGSLGNPGPSWHAIGTGDYNGDGRSDILWQNASGDASIWEMNGTSVVGGGDLGNPGPSWHLHAG